MLWFLRYKDGARGVRLPLIEAENEQRAVAAGKAFVGRHPGRTYISVEPAIVARDVELSPAVLAVADAEQARLDALAMRQGERKPNPLPSPLDSLPPTDQAPTPLGGGAGADLGGAQFSGGPIQTPPSTAAKPAGVRR